MLYDDLLLLFPSSYNHVKPLISLIRLCRMSTAVQVEFYAALMYSFVSQRVEVIVLRIRGSVFLNVLFLVYGKLLYTVRESQEKH